MEEENQENLPIIINNSNLIMDINQNEILQKDIGSETISSQKYIEKNENEIKEINEDKHIESTQIKENQITIESNNNKDYRIIKQLLNIQKLIQKELSTRKICKY